MERDINGNVNGNMRGHKKADTMPLTSQCRIKERKQNFRSFNTGRQKMDKEERDCVHHPTKREKS